MFNHEPDDYQCPFCRLVTGGEDARRTQRDIVRRDELATAFRYVGDDLYGTRPYPDFVPAEQRWPFADKLREHLEAADLPG